MKICYFTGTGNSLYVSQRIGGELLSVPQLMKEDHPKIQDDAVGIVCPVYGGDMPRMVRAFLSTVEIQADYIFFVYTYGMSQGTGKGNALNVTKKAGIKLDYINAVRMVDNYLPGFEMQKQMDTAAQKDIEGQIDRVCRDIEMRIENVSKIHRFQKWAAAAVHATISKALVDRNAAKKYIVDDNCILCGICAKVCPAGNIKITDKVTFLNRCEVCYACVHNCPQNAIHLKNERSAVRFRNEHISLKEIIESNE